MCLNFGFPKVFASSIDSATADDLMKASASNLAQIKNLLSQYKAQVENLKNTKVPEGLFEKAECAKINRTVIDVTQMVVAIIIAVIAIISAIWSGPSSASLSLEALIAAIKEAKNLEAYIASLNKMIPALQTAFQNFYATANNTKDLAAAVTIFATIANDKAHAAKLLEAIRAKNRSSIEELLKSNISGSTVEIREAKEENGVFISLRVGSFNHCLSTTNQCGGKSASVSK